MSTMAERLQAAELEASRLRCENEKLRYVAMKLLEANRLVLDAGKLHAQAVAAVSEAIGQFTFPTIPNN